jgi:hypothetical protein
LMLAQHLPMYSCRIPASSRWSSACRNDRPSRLRWSGTTG